MIRYAIRNEEGKWRSARYSRAFGDWDGAQLWENGKTAQAEMKKWANHEKWVWPEGTGMNAPRHKVPDPVKCTLVAINIEEPK